MGNVTDRKKLEKELELKTRELDRRDVELSILLELSREIVAASGLEKVINTIINLAPKLLQADLCLLWLWNEAKSLLEMVVPSNLTAAYPKTIKDRERIPNLCFQEVRPIVAEDLSRDPESFTSYLAGQKDYQSMACIPIRARDKVIGVISILSQESKKFEEREVSRLSIFAEQAGLAIENAKTYERIRESKRRHRSLIENLIDPCFETDIAGNFTFVNEALCEASGYLRNELIGMNNRSYADQENAAKVYQAFNRLYTTGEPCRVIHEIITKRGSRIYTETYASLIYNERGEKVGFRGIARDITEHRHLLIKLAKAEESYHRLFETVNDALFVANLDGYFPTYNRMFLKMTGYSEEEIKTLHFSKLIHPEDLPVALERKKLLSQGKKAPERLSFRLINKAGKTIYVEGNFRRIKDREQVVGTLGAIRDITEKIRIEQELQKLSITDELTGLYNQRHFSHELEKEIERSKRHGTTFTLMLFDLDGFKHYNDSHGHLEGDKILKKVAQITIKVIRKIDTAYRYGGDEFMVILPGTGIEKGCAVAERIRKHCQNSGRTKITLSIGLVEYDPKYDTQSLIKSADLAMYNVKKIGGNRVLPFA